MKFSATILSLSAIHAANAFMVHQPKAFSHALYSSFETNPAAAPAQAESSYSYTSSIQEQGTSPMVKYEDDGPKTTLELFERVTPVKVQGGSLKTCSFNEDVQRVAVYLRTEGRPLNANVELWQGPDNSPQKMSVYLEDGKDRPFNCVVESPGASNSISIRNTAEMEFPLVAGLDVECDQSSVSAAKILRQKSDSRTVQGGAVYTSPFAPAVKSIQVLLETDGRPLNARIELLQGPNNNKQVMEVYTEDGNSRPFYCIIDTPGTGNVVRIVNTATIEFPITACVEPYLIEENSVYQNTSSEPGGMMWT